MLWEYGKVPEVVVEIVSNKEGGELDHKLKTYARKGIHYYIVFDPLRLLSEDVLRVYEPGLLNHYRRKFTSLPIRKRASQFVGASRKFRRRRLSF